VDEDVTMNHPRSSIHIEIGLEEIVDSKPPWKHESCFLDHTSTQDRALDDSSSGGTLVFAHV
jgi:hypothetical protein